VDGLLDRLAGCERLGPVYIAGPVSVYGHLADRAELIDTDGSFGENIRAAIEALRQKHPGSPIAFITCDVVPDKEVLDTVMDQYAAHRPCDLWHPFIRIPDDPARLGAFGWKPSYRVVLREGEPPVNVLPGHLIVIDPEALRLEFLYQLLQLAYRTRNRSIEYRIAVTLSRVLARLLYEDLLHLFTLRAPNLTWGILRATLPTSRALKKGTLTLDRAESSLRVIFVKASHRRRHPDRRTLLPIVEGLSLAMDIDTEEEARAMGGDVSGGRAGDER
jgi:hypothetical protein